LSKKPLLTALPPLLGLAFGFALTGIAAAAAAAAAAGAAGTAGTAAAGTAAATGLLLVLLLVVLSLAPLAVGLTVIDVGSGALTAASANLQ
jgi:hypothetical protein